MSVLRRIAAWFKEGFDDNGCDWCGGSGYHVSQLGFDGPCPRCQAGRERARKDREKRLLDQERERRRIAAMVDAEEERRES